MNVQKFYTITISTCMCWTREMCTNSTVNGGHAGRYRHVVQISEHDTQAKARSALDENKRLLNEILYMDERHRLVPVYEFLLTNMDKNRWKRNDIDNDNDDNDNNDNNDDDDNDNTRKQKDKPNIVRVRKKNHTLLDHELPVNIQGIMDTLLVVAIPLSDSTTRRSTIQLRRAMKKRAIVTVVLLCDTNVRTWCGAIRDYLIAINDGHDEMNDELINTNKVNTNESTSSPIYDALPPTQFHQGLRNSCELLKSQVNSYISSKSDYEY